MIPGDPSCYRGTDILINRYDFRDADLLSAVEYRFATARAIELEVKPINGKFDFDNLKAIHKHLFQDTYDWAGTTRLIDFGKRSKDTGLVSRFVPLAQMDEKIASFNLFIARHNQLKGLNKTNFIQAFSEVQARLNEIHPFREGNGRATRIYMQHLARDAGFDFDFEKIDKDKWNLASHKSLVQHDPKKIGITYPPSLDMMREVLSLAVKPTIDHAFESEEKDSAIKDHPGIAMYFDRLRSIASKVEQLSATGDASDVSNLLSSAHDHILQKLKSERVDLQQTAAIEKLAAIRPEVLNPNAEIYGPVDNLSIIKSDMRDVYIKKGYSPEDVEISMQKTSDHIDKIAAMREDMEEYSRSQFDRPRS